MSTPTTRARTQLRRLVRVVVMAAAVAWPITSAAPAGSATPTPFADIGIEHIGAFDAAYSVEPDGSMLVTETIDYDTGVVPRHGLQRDLVVRQRYNDTNDRLYPLQVLSVTTSPGTPGQWRILNQSGGVKRIRVGDPNRTITGRHRYVLRYRLRQVLNGFADHDELYWNATGNDWLVPISATTLHVTTPSPVTGVRCFIGPRGSTLPCTSAKSSGTTATFTNGELPPGSGLTIVAGLTTAGVAPPQPILRERWAFTRAFSATTTTVPAAIVVLLVAIAAVLTLVWRHGRDRRAAGSAIDMAFPQADGTEENVRPFADLAGPVQFEPPDNIRPGQLGTLIDQRANPLDVTATIVDLAARGYLTIEELPHRRILGKPDWTLTKGKGGGDLLEYERALFDGLFTAKDTVRVSTLRNNFASRMQKVENALYDDAVTQGWFVRRPDRVRSFWKGMGVVALVLAGGLTFLLAKYTHAGLLGVALVVGALVLLVSARWMPSRTVKGTAALIRALGFRRFMVESDPEREHFAERRNLFTEYLPYAVVFGVTEKWARAFAGLDGEVPGPTWYVSSHPFEINGFAHAIDGFTVASAGTLTSTPGGSGGSGFSGGSSGGGGGGGGGGGW
jgi:uncharacterized membrane protein YgcG